MDKILKNNGYSWYDFIKVFSAEYSLLLSNVENNDLVIIFDYISRNFSDISLDLIQKDKSISVLLRYQRLSINSQTCGELLKQGENYYKNAEYEQSLSCFYKLNSIQDNPRVYTYVMLALASAKVQKHKNTVNCRNIVKDLVMGAYSQQEVKIFKYDGSIEYELLKDVSKSFGSGSDFANVLNIFCLERQLILAEQTDKNCKKNTKKYKINFTWS